MRYHKIMGIDVRNINTNMCETNQLKCKQEGRLPTEEGKIRKENSISFVINLCVVKIISFDGFHAKIMLILYNITHDTTPPNAINILPNSIDFGGGRNIPTYYGIKRT